MLKYSEDSLMVRYLFEMIPINKKILKEIFNPTIILVCAYLFSGMALAQSVEIADDFSVNSIRLSSEVQDNEDGVSSVDAALGGIRMSSTTIGSENVRARLNVNEQTESFQISGRFDPDSINLNEGFTQISMGGNLSNDIPLEDRPDPDSNVGNISIAIISSVFQDNSTNLFVCFGRNGEDGFEDLNLFAENSQSCMNYDDFAPAVGEEFTIGFSIGEDNVVELILGATTDTLTLPGTFNPPVRPFRDISQESNRGPGGGSFLVTSITTDSESTDFAITAPILDRYNFNVPGREGFPTIVDERLRADFTAREDGGNSVSLELRDIGTYFEATTELSSESTFGEAGQNVGSAILVVMGNDIQNNGTEGSIGDVRADIVVEARPNGLRRIEYCLRRFEDADGDIRTGLLNDGQDGCIQFPLLAEFDTPYRMAIDFDLASSTVTFQINGITQTETLPALFAANSPRADVEVFGRNGARFVGFIDDIRNSRSALTTVEASGDGLPAPFPPEPSAESTIFDSSLDAPYDFNLTPLSFVDDFSTDTSVLGLDSFGEADSSLTYTDGAVELQVHTNREPDEGGGATGFRIGSVSDTIVVVGALSSDSRTGPGNRNEVSFDVEATLFNDTVDGGLDNEEGDIQVKIRIQMEGNGRRRVEAEYRRRTADGNNDRLAVFPNGEDRYTFEDFIPELDTFYTLTLQLDRANQQFIFGLEDQSVAVPIPGGIFDASANRGLIRAFHQGASGRAEIRLQSIEIDDQLFDFSQEAPVLAPYRPTFESEPAGVDTFVVDGRLRLEADGRVSPDRDPQIRIRGRSTFVGADIELSSESTVTADDSVFVGVSGILYSEIDNGDEDRTGSVFVAVRLTLEGDGTRYVERCAFRSNDENFDSSDELIGGNPQMCTRFDTVPELDTEYPASIAVDEEARTLTLVFADEILVYDITSDIFTVLSGFNGVRARTGNNSRVVAFADNLAFSDDPEPLALSDQNFGNIVGVSQTDGTDTGDLESGDTTTGLISSSGGGGGCAIGGGGNPGLILLALIAMLRLHRVKSIRL